MSSTTSDPLVGVLLDGRYRVHRRLASGGMSRVYVGHDSRLDRPVAIKVMNAELAADPPFLARFTREAQAAARLLHPNIVTVHDQGADPDNDAVYLIMELVRGGTLRDLLRSHGQLTPGEALAVIEPMLTGLAAAHHAGLVHRDIKPENILIDTDGRVLIADFGLARAVAQSSHTTHAGVGGAVFGTVAYLSPEQISEGYADARSDVYAVGIMLYELLTGAPPYVGDNPVSMAYRHVNDDVPPPSEVLPETPGELDDVVIEATNRDPLNRPADAAALLTMVRQARTALGIRDVAVPTPRLPRALRDEAAREVLQSAVTGSESTGATAVVGPDGSTAEVDGGTAEVPDDTSGVADTPAIAMATSTDTDDEEAQDAHHSTTEIRVRRPRRWLLPTALVAVLLLLAGTGVWWWQWGRWTEVPDFSTATSQQEVASIAKEAGLNVDLQPAQFSETVPDGHVLSASPDAGTRVTRGTDIKIVLSKGPERYVVSADRIGQPAAEVISELQKEFGDRVTIVSESDFSEEIGIDLVAAFNPPAGTLLSPGETLTVVVSLGRSPIAIPDLTGTDPDEAVTTLTDLGFVPTVSETQEFSDVPAGKVTRTDPIAGMMLQPDAQKPVTIYVSKGPDLVQVPNTVGMSSQKAKETLEAAGFAVKIVYVFSALDLVADQSPAGGTMAKRGSTVTIRVA